MMTLENLAEWLCENVRRRRLERIGEADDSGEVGHVPFPMLTAEDREPWLDCAAAVIDLIESGELHENGRRHVSETARLESLDTLIRLIVDLDVPRLTVDERETLVGHLTGATFVHGRT